METTGQQVLAAARSDRLRIYSIPAGNNTPLPFTHLDSKKSLRRNDFFSQFWKGGIGIFGSRKSGSKRGENNSVDIRKTFSKEGIQYPYPNRIASKSDYNTTAF